MLEPSLPNVLQEDQAAALEGMDLALDYGDIDGARGWIARLTGPEKLAAEAWLAAATEDGEKALEALAALGRTTPLPAGLLEQARASCIHAGLADEADAVLCKLMVDPAAAPEVGTLWARSRAYRGTVWAVMGPMRTFDPRSPAVRAAAAAWLESLTRFDRKEAKRDVGRFMRERFAPPPDDLWALIGRTLLDGGALRDASRFLADWRDRAKARPWMLEPVARTARRLRRDADALAIVRRAAAIRPTDESSASHQVWLAYDLALRGEATEARRSLADAGDTSGRSEIVPLRAVTEAMLALQEASPADRGRVFRRVRRDVDAVRSQCTRPELRRAHARASHRIASDAASLLARAWAYRFALRTAAVMVVLGGFALLLAVELPGRGINPLPLLFYALFLGRAVAKSRLTS
jgi:hypothetical protein